MLVLNRKEGERIVIGDNIVITVVRGGSDRIRLGISAPREIPIRRKEIPPQLNAAASESPGAVKSPYFSEGE